ncbi:hypothetical protein CHS0354_036941 [Potamilus streckersoni]|uniref:UNC93-like protein n=1 Tax=Potamilus streckersoni TaxID=2493646 RepID=A0AAE0WAR0_9BIVA|nr:hypothetical protein CHS0354_036941 [Potamilus streckersoni]
MTSNNVSQEINRAVTEGFTSFNEASFYHVSKGEHAKDLCNTESPESGSDASHDIAADSTLRRFETCDYEDARCGNNNTALLIPRVELTSETPAITDSDFINGSVPKANETLEYTGSLTSNVSNALPIPSQESLTHIPDERWEENVAMSTLQILESPEYTDTWGSSDSTTPLIAKDEPRSQRPDAKDNSVEISPLQFINGRECAGTWCNENTSARISKDQLSSPTPEVGCEEDQVPVELMLFMPEVRILSENVTPPVRTLVTPPVTTLVGAWEFGSLSSICFTDDFQQKGNLANSKQILGSTWTFGSVSSVFISKDGRARTNTMKSMLENPAFRSILSSPVSIKRQPSQACTNILLAQNILKDGKDIITYIPSKRNPVADSVIQKEITLCSQNMKNLVVIGLGVMLVYIAMGSLRNLQSSINHEGGIGLYSLAVTFGMFMIGSLITPFLLKRYRPKHCLVISFISPLLYVLANIYPKLYIFLPVSGLTGFSNALTWNSVSTHITQLSLAESCRKQTSLDSITSVFFGTFFLIFQFSFVIGNLISSVILSQGRIVQSNPHSMMKSGSTSFGNVSALFDSIVLNTTYNKSTSELINDSISSHCGTEYCHWYPIDTKTMEITEETKGFLIGTYAICVILAIVIVLVFLDPLPDYRTELPHLRDIGNQLVSVMKMMLNKKFALVLMLIMYSIFLGSFVTAEITKAYVTCPLGIHMVGYTMICFGVVGAASSFISGHLIKHIGRMPVIVIAGVKSIILLVLMSMWDASAGPIVLYFLLLGAWGFVDGILSSQTNGIIGAVFSDQYEEAFGSLRFVQGVAGVIVFSYANFVCMQVKIVLMGILCIVSVFLYVTMEILQKRETRNLKENTPLQTSV